MSSMLTTIDVILYSLMTIPILALATTVFGASPIGFLRIMRDVIDTILSWTGRTIAWTSLFMVLVMFVVVVLRYVYGLGFIWMQESVVYMHGALFMLAAAYTLAIDGHVRVDVFYREATERTKALTNLLGTYLFLFPVMFLIIDMGLPYVEVAWEVREGSKETSGIQAIYLLKSVILAFAWMMILQGISLATSAVLYLLGDSESHNPNLSDRTEAP